MESEGFTSRLNKKKFNPAEKIYQYNPQTLGYT